MLEVISGYAPFGVHRVADHRQHHEEDQEDRLRERGADEEPKV